MEIDFSIVGALDRFGDVVGAEVEVRRACCPDRGDVIGEEVGDIDDCCADRVSANCSVHDAGKHHAAFPGLEIQAVGDS